MMDRQVQDWHTRIEEKSLTQKKKTRKHKKGNTMERTEENIKNILINVFSVMTTYFINKTSSSETLENRKKYQQLKA